MSTRIYYEILRYHPINPAISSDWYGYESISYARYKYCAVTKQNEGTTWTAMSNLPGVPAPKNNLAYAFVTDPLNGPGTVSGTVKGQLLASETASTVDWCRAVKIKIVSNDGSVERGVLLSHFPETLVSEFNIGSRVNRYYPPESELTPVEYQDGDRLVIEIGIRSFSEGYEDGDLYITNDRETDLPEDEVETDDLNSWIEFSQDIEFSNRLLISQNIAQVLTSNESKLKVSQLIAQILYTPKVTGDFSDFLNFSESLDGQNAEEGILSDDFNLEEIKNLLINYGAEKIFKADKKTFSFPNKTKNFNFETNKKVFTFYARQKDEV